MDVHILIAEYHDQVPRRVEPGPAQEGRRHQDLHERQYDEPIFSRCVARLLNALTECTGSDQDLCGRQYDSAAFGAFTWSYDRNVPSIRLGD